VSNPTWSVAEAHAGQRLDRSVAARLEVARNQVQRWIREGRVRVNGQPARAAAPLQIGDRIEVDLPERRDDRLEPETGELVLLHADDDVIVLDKPAGLAVHPGAGRSTGTLAHRLLARFPEIGGVGGPGRPGIVHRLDRDTTGVMVVARSDRAYATLSTAFAQRRTEKSYLALVYGAPPVAGTIERPIGRHPERRQEMTVLERGRPALTRFRTRAALCGIALVEVDLRTGRTHQIRVHMKSIGHPLVGDPVYGEARYRGLPRRERDLLEPFPRPALHAWRLAFDHPDRGERVCFEAPPPPDLIGLWQEVTQTPWPLSGTGAAAGNRTT
jgi:23S rRNA pseudouridine1911/1915/1917 synthase